MTGLLFDKPIHNNYTWVLVKSALSFEMTSTSLAEQLKRLQRPQTSQLVDLRKRPSILFDAKEAAEKDRETIFEIGLSGLQVSQSV